MRRVHLDPLLATLGAGCVIAAAADGGLSVVGISIPQPVGVPNEAMLGVVGIALLILSAVTRVSRSATGPPAVKADFEGSLKVLGTNFWASVRPEQVFTRREERYQEARLLLVGLMRELINARGPKVANEISSVMDDIRAWLDGAHDAPADDEIRRIVQDLCRNRFKMNQTELR